MEKKAKILVLCPDMPFPIRAGGQMRMASLIQALSEFSTVNVAFIASQSAEETLCWAGEHSVSLERLVPRKPSSSDRFAERLAILLARSNLRNRLYERAFFDRAFESYAPDLVWLETPYLLRYALSWKKKAPLVVDYWGTSEGANRLWKVTTGPIKIWKWLFWRAALRAEQQLTPQVENIVCVSSVDAAFFRNLAPKSRIWPIPIGVPKREPPLQAAAILEDPRVMIFTGDMSFTPNVDAVLWFTKEVLPLVLQKLPDAKLRIVGRDPVPTIKRLNHHGSIEVQGYVPDLTEAIAGSGLYVLPMRLGAGFRSKLLDVFPLRKAIISTSIGAEGLELHHGVNCIIADSAQDFAEGCIRLLNSENERHRLGEAVGRLASETYSQENITRLARKTVIDILGES